LAPLATRDMEDVYKLMRMAEGKSIPATELMQQYSGAEINEITGVLKKLYQVRDIVLKVNQQYIASAAQQDKYRTEPAFKLQGSYRNMNKMAEKVSAVMNDQELMQMISDHYLGEAQLLTSGAEHNLLKLAELRGDQTEEQEQRWNDIVQRFQKDSSLGGDEGDHAARVVSQLYDLGKSMEAIASLLDQRLSPASEDAEPDGQEQMLDEVRKVREALQDIDYSIEVVNQPVPGISKLLVSIADTFEHSLYPLVHAMEGKLNIDLQTQQHIASLFTEMRSLREGITSSSRVKGKLFAPDAE